MQDTHATCGQEMSYCTRVLSQEGKDPLGKTQDVRVPRITTSGKLKSYSTAPHTILLGVTLVHLSTTLY